MTDAGRGGRRRPPRSPLRFLVGPFLGILLLPASAGAEGPSIVRITMQEFAFRPATVRVRAGRPVRLLLVNQGQIAHQFDTAYLRAVPVRAATG